MNLLLDENLSPRLLQRLASLFPVLIHVRNIGLKRASDVMIWDWAKVNCYTIVTTDADFAALSRSQGMAAEGGPSCGMRFSATDHRGTTAAECRQDFGV